MLANLLAAEQAQIAAGATVCAFTCTCHGGYTCQRAVHADSPHLAVQPNGDLIQWGQNECPTEEQAAAHAETARADEAADREAATRALLAQLDPKLLVAILKEQGHL